MRTTFWRFAHKRYQIKASVLLAEIAAFMWAIFFILVYGAALLVDWRPDTGEAIASVFLIGTPPVFGVLHRRIRVEAAKGPDALYRKRLCEPLGQLRD